MNQTSIILIIVAFNCLLIIVTTSIVAYQFVRQEQALDKIENMLNPEPETEANPTSSLYGSYQECINEWNKPVNLEILRNVSLTLTPEQMCDEYK